MKQHILSHPSLRGLWAACVLPAALLAGCSSAPTSPTAAAPGFAPQSAPTSAPCPSGVPAQTRCLAGTDSEGAHYLIAMPAAWSGVLVLHAHGGPELGAPKAERTGEDLKRWLIMVKAGHAWAGSTFRQGGVAVRSAAEDTERLRRIFVAHVAQPKHTVLHGQSWGAGVAAKAAEMYAAPGTSKPAYDAVLLTSGVLGGGTRSYDVRLDLRVIYQHLCANHPKADEPQYPLWMGLPPDAKLTRTELSARVDDCLGLRHPAAQRTAEQRAKVAAIVNVLKIPERTIQGHLNWGTWHFQDIVQQRTGGLNPFGNTGARYTGSHDDATLNATVLRYRADPAAVQRFGTDTDFTGRIGVPVLTVHGVDDPIAFVELESAFRQTMAQGGSAANLVQTFADSSEHSYLSDPTYPALVDSLLGWAVKGTKPTAMDVAARCREVESRFGPGCRFLPDYQPKELETRVTPRQR